MGGRFVARHYVSNRNPQTPADLARVLADPARAAELFGGSTDSWTAFQDEYAQANPVLGRLAEEASQLQLQEQLRAGGGTGIPRAIGGTAGNGKRGKLYNRKAPGAQLDNILPQTEHPLAQLVRVADTRNESTQPLRTQLHAIQNGLSERVPGSGGLLVPEILRSDLLQLSLESAIIRPRCRIIQMDSLRVPYPGIDDTSHATSVYGGITAFWTEEGAALQQSAPSFDRVILEAKKLTAFTQIPQELIQDSAEGMLEDWLRTAWPAAVSYYEDDAFINGTGVGEPQGFLSAPCAIKVATSSANVITMLDLISAYVRFLPAALPGAVWLASPDVKKQLMLLALTAQSATSNVQPIAPPAWFVDGNAIAGTPATLFGHEIHFSEKMPSCSSSNTTVAGALSLANFSYFLLGDRMQMQLAMSEQYSFQNDLVSWRLIQRCDARAWPVGALTPRNGGATLSPFVLVDTTS
jgi:HK97 family phage major capsid protein